MEEGASDNERMNEKAMKGKESDSKKGGNEAFSMWGGWSVFFC
jgi:hypothetical protein